MVKPKEVEYSLDELATEGWLDIPGFEGYYQASNLGRFRALPRVITRSNGIIEHKPGRILKNNYYSNGYVQLILYVERKRSNFIGHRIIAQMFIDNPENKDTVNHINGIKNDLRVTNLEWCTRSENSLHAHRTGLLKPNPQRGEKNSRTKLTDLEATEIRRTYTKGKLNKEVFMKYQDKVSKSVFKKISRGDIWKHINI